jgi:AraC-like DNA-binding protein
MPDSPPRRIRHTELPGQWTLALGEPDARLRPLIAGYCGYAELGVAPPQRQLPHPDVVVIIGLGPAIRVVDERDPASANRACQVFAAGLYDAAVVTTSLGPTRGIQLNFTALGARRFLGVGMHAIANRVVELRDLLGHDADNLVGRLQDAATWEAAFALIDAAILSRASRTTEPPPEVEWAWRLLRQRGGTLRIESLAREVGWSQKHLIAQFREHVGVSPKQFAGIVRFHRLIAGLATRRDVRWPDLAAAHGYYDQSHLVHDFRKFAGMTPSAYLGAR